MNKRFNSNSDKEDEKSFSQNNSYDRDNIDNSFSSQGINNPFIKILNQNINNNINNNGLDNNSNIGKDNQMMNSFIFNPMMNQTMMEQMNNNSMMSQMGMNQFGMNQINNMPNQMENNMNNIMNPMGMPQIGNNIMNNIGNNMIDQANKIMNSFQNNSMNPFPNMMGNSMENNNMMEQTDMINPSLGNNNMINNRGSINNNEISGMNTNIMNLSATMNQMMDENTMRIKEIIKPYEDKIKELEETIRKNTFQMVLLKQKLKQKGNVNKNQMNLMGMNMVNSDNDIIQISFQYDLNVFQNVKCLNDELFESVVNRYCRKYNKNRNGLEFYFFGNIINTSLTLSELGIYNNSLINVQSTMNQMNFGVPNNFVDMNIFNLNTENRINLVFKYKEEKCLIFLKQSSTVEDSLKEFLKKKQISDNESKKLIFLYNDKKLELNDKRRLGEVFIGIGFINVI